MITIEKVLSLKQLDLFKSVSNMALADLMAVAEEQTVRPGTVLIHENQPNKTLYFLLSGTVVVRYNKSQKEMSAKEVLGLHSVFWSESANEHVEVVQKSVVLSVTQDKLYRVMALHPSLAFAVLNELSRVAHQ